MIPSLYLTLGEQLKQEAQREEELSNQRLIHNAIAPHTGIWKGDPSESLHPVDIIGEEATLTVSNESSLKTYTTFCGADMTVIINGQAVGELEGIRYMLVTPTLAELLGNAAFVDTAYISSYPVIGLATFVVFNEEPNIPQDQNHYDIVMQYATEHGQAAHQKITEARTLSVSGAMTIDTITPSRHVIFMAKGVTPLTPGWSPDYKSYTADLARFKQRELNKEAFPESP